MISFPIRWLKHGYRRVPLRFVLVVPFVLQTTVAVGLTGWLSIRNGTTAVNDLVDEYQNEIVSNVQQELAFVLDTPHRINQLSAEALASGYIAMDDPQGLERYFWQQLRNHPRMTYIYAGNGAGGIVGVGKLSSDRYRVFQSEGFRAGEFQFFTANEEGDRLTPTAVAEPFYDARQRPWYQAALEAKQPTWSEIYLYAGEEILGISASYPVYGQETQLEGVLAVDLSLERISEFLRSHHPAGKGQTFILERSGYLVASSTDEKPFIPSASNGNQRRRHLSQSQSPILQAITERLQDDPGLLQTTEQLVESPLPLAGDRHFLRVIPFQDRRGLDWLILVTIPEAEFMGQIHANTRQTILMCLGALGISIVLGGMTAQWITRPISKLSDASRAIADGDFTQTVSLNREDEVGTLAHSFNRMAGQLRQSFQSMEDRAQELEERVQERTQHLLEANRRLEAEIEERKRMGAWLKASEEKYRALFEGSQDAVMLFDGQEFVDCNTATLAMFSCDTKAQFCTQHPLDFSPPYQPDGQRSEALGKRHMAIAKQTGTHTFEWLHRRLDGHLFWADVRLSAIQIDRQPLVQAVVRDITQRKQNEDTLRRAKEAAESANQAKSSFLRTMSHELRTPLNGILGFAQTLRKTPNLPAKHYDGLRVIQQSGEHLLELIEELLDFSRLEAQRMELHPTAFSLREMLQNIAAFFTPRARQQGIAFYTDISLDTDDALWGDAQRLRQVLINLIGNAIKFTDQGHITLRVSPSPHALSTHSPSPLSFRFEVEDTGIGIAEPDLETIFQPFLQIQNPRHPREGTGLGLAISQKLIEMMGGTLRLESTVGKGSRFWFDLAFAPASQGPAASGLHPSLSEDDSPSTIYDDEAIAPSPDLTDRSAPAVLSNRGKGYDTAEPFNGGTLPIPDKRAIADLQGLARIGDVQGILAYLDALEHSTPSLSPFAHALRHLAQTFQVRKIRTYLEQASLMARR